MTDEELKAYRNKQSKAKRRYNDKAYDRVFVCVPKGCSDILKKYADERGESVNALVNSLLLKELGLTEWPYKYDKWEEKVLPIDEIPD